MINPCVKCPERDRCEGMNQPCKQGKAYQKWKAGCKRVAEHTKRVNNAEYNKLEQELMNDEITPDEHVERYNALMELEPQSFGPPELHEHI